MTFACWLLLYVFNFFCNVNMLQNVSLDYWTWEKEQAKQQLQLHVKALCPLCRQLIKENL